MSTATVRPFEVTHRGVLAIAIPMTLAYLSTPLVGLVDTGVIGQLGDAALIGGIALGAVIFDIVFTTMNFLRSGTTGLTAQAHGAQDRTEVDASFFRALIVAVAIGFAVLALKDVILEVALSLIGGSEAVQAATRTYYGIRVLATPFALINYVILGWLIGLNRAGLALVLQTVLNGVNIGLSLYLVLGLDYGVAGVGWASFAAEAVTAAVGFFIAFGLIERMRMPHRGVILDRGALIRMIAVNRDIMIRSFALLFAFAFFTSQSAAHGDVVLAANQVLMTLFFVGSFFLDGMATAAEQLAGRSVGARYRPAFDRSLKLTVGWGFAIGFAASLVFWIAGPAIIDAMTTNEAVRETARLYLPFAALTPLVGTLAFQMDGVFIGATWSADMRNMMLLSLALYVAIWWMLTPLLGVSGLWIALLVFLGARGLSLLWRTRARAAMAFPGGG
ncbi:MATE family efflux transporter [Bauldia litoralis]|uniref:Multidrug resistance protein, MATE family n=1 Tax=Bauldia litoralis TaxID=665467 RepID=A0A1G6E5T0_9HYPH|nr:MATE family efflux transporter [Bauldia litoralis]SDB52680.1 multidrug resistance protein, MATE family [Bauldia litoralis]